MLEEHIRLVYEVEDEEKESSLVAVTSNVSAWALNHSSHLYHPKGIYDSLMEAVGDSLTIQDALVKHRVIQNLTDLMVQSVLESMSTGRLISSHGHDTLLMPNGIVSEQNKAELNSLIHERLKLPTDMIEQASKG